MSIDRTDILTDYEYEYEFLQDVAYKEMISEHMNNQAVDPNSQEFSREFKMDQAEYDHIKEMAENGEFVDFEIPLDAPIGKRYSDKGTTDEDAFIPVDLTKEFGGDR